VLQREEFKIVYVAPMKALAAEITGAFSRRLDPLGILAGPLYELNDKVAQRYHQDLNLRGHCPVDCLFSLPMVDCHSAWKAPGFNP
jgi:hypothetical protein